jgi:hypothetical protein
MMGAAGERYAELVKRLTELNKIADNERVSPAARDAAWAEREAMGPESLELFAAAMAEMGETAVSEPVVVDRGLVMLMVDLILQVRRQVEREMERTDLTPYMWSMLKSRYDSLSRTLRIFEGRPIKQIDDWTKVEYLLLAEFDDGSVDFKEAVDADEARLIEEAFVAEGAVVTRYAVYPETGTEVLLFYPVMPHENIHKTMTPRQYHWVLRAKGERNLKLPESPEEYFASRPTLVTEYD